MKFTKSIPERRVNMSFLASAQYFVTSSGDIRAILTRHGMMGRIWSAEHFMSMSMSKSLIALNICGWTGFMKESMAYNASVFYNFFTINNGNGRIG